MHIEHLAVSNFRNLERLSLDLDDGTVVLRGANAQGKTNLLEALYVCATGKSFRNARPAEMLRHDAEAGWVKGRFIRRGVRHEVEVSLSKGRRSIRVDGRGMRSVSKLLELVNVVAFFPDDLRIVKGSPEERRRFVDRAVANHRPEFVQASQSYGKALKERNALLRAERAPDRTLLRVYDEQLCEHGSVIHTCRQQTLEELLPIAAERFVGMMRDMQRMHARLTLGFESKDEPSSHADAFLMALTASYPRDRARGMTTVGPHRADLELFVADQSARQFASQGQQRALVLSLKLAELAYLRERLGSPPVLLLDDVSSELDRERTAMLFEALAAHAGQVWISTTGATELPLQGKTRVFTVSSGGVQALSEALGA